GLCTPLPSPTMRNHKERTRPLYTPRARGCQSEESLWGGTLVDFDGPEKGVCRFATPQPGLLENAGHLRRRVEVGLERAAPEAVRDIEEADDQTDEPAHPGIAER